MQLFLSRFTIVSVLLGTINAAEPATPPATPAEAKKPAPLAFPQTPLREAFANDFLIGAAMNMRQVSGRDAATAEMVGKQFSTLTPENEMKWMSVHPQPGRYEFQAADAFVDFARKHDMKLIGHALVWHSQTPDWVFKGKTGAVATREELLALMREHIHTIAGRYKGKIHGWDVVNEALADGGPELLRDSPWKRIIGDDFLDHAFRYAREAAPDAELYYNDYGLENPQKRRNCMTLLRGMIKRGVPIDGVGTQSHLHLLHPPIEDVENTIKDLASLGLKVMVTELDVDVLPSRGNFGNADVNRREKADPALNPYTAGLPDDVQQKLTQRYQDLFTVYLRHRQSISRVTLWGAHDGACWLNFFPIPWRTNHALLINRELQPKPAFLAVHKLAQATTAPAKEKPKSKSR